MNDLIQTLARELDAAPGARGKCGPADRRGGHHPLHRPIPEGAARLYGRPAAAPAGRPPAISPGPGRPERGRSAPPSRGRASSPRTCPPHWTPPPRWRRWRTCTAPISRSGAPAPPWPGRRDWSLWPPWPRPGGPRWIWSGPHRTMWTRKGGGDGGRPHSRGPATSWLRRSPTGPTCGRSCASCTSRRGVLTSKAADKEPEDSVYRLYYDFKCPVSRVQGYQTLAINRGSGRSC